MISLEISRLVMNAKITHHNLNNVFTNRLYSKFTEFCAQNHSNHDCKLFYIKLNFRYTKQKL